jgi:hypothetical protein
MTVKLKTQLVKPNFHLSMKCEQKGLVEHIINELTGVDLSNLKLDPDFIRYIAELIENQVKTNDAQSKPNKLDIFIEIIKKLFPNIATQDIDNAKGILEFLLKNKMVKKIKLCKVISYYLKKKFL